MFVVGGACALYGSMLSRRAGDVVDLLAADARIAATPRALHDGATLLSTHLCHGVNIDGNYALFIIHYNDMAFILGAFD